MEIQNLFTAGGVVMWPLLAFSVLAVALMIERVRFWVRINQRQSRVVRDVLNLYRLDNLVGAMDKLQKNADSPLARIFLGDFQRIKYTANKNDNHFKEGERRCLCLPLSPNKYARQMSAQR